MDAPEATAWIVLGGAGGATGEHVEAVELAADGSEIARTRLGAHALSSWVRDREGAAAPRWVWNDTPGWYAGLLADGVRVGRCHDLRLAHAILRDAVSVREAPSLRAAHEWDGAPAEPTAFDAAATLFSLEGDRSGFATGPPDGMDAALQEFERQRIAVARSDDPARLRLLIAAESAGALLAVEMRAAGLPWDAVAHDRLLTDQLGPRPVAGAVPRRMQEVAAEVRSALGDPAASLDSQPKLLRSLHRIGIPAESTSKWALAEYEHPVIAPLLEYRRLSRLYTANGWAWLDEWVHEGRFRPVYVPGGVVTGRWASSGGGALQLPRQLRSAVRADPGWKLVVADVAQLEPRVLAAMASDGALATAARGRDLYVGIVESGVVATRAEAKIALLGAMYGATTGDSARLLPRLRSAYPRAMALVDEAARVGDDGGVVSTWLGRSSPPPSASWHDVQAKASDVGSSRGDEDRARRWARDRGRFTRNFVVQGTAAEWALAWLADLRGRLAAMPLASEGDAAIRSGRVFARRPHLALFLHDEVIVHVPEPAAPAVADAVREAADAAAALLFGAFPIDFPLDVRIADTADKS
ncbi:bifunctional 3'-5' exonuclease/DNA polymerase [Microbacterium rhizomatis]|uniref:bifunctional 3'-5' exonuclease/DNA polymerase n=1 Tax=Microbacterium rhizomatis TaxID=1631477 RepID=UPI001FECB996|nr:bifunctional 3'-5' exonuclease/DNA polymerase [Microbacterium rhizomatis]